MTAGEFCNREVVVTRVNEPVRTAINLMRKHHVGDVVVVDEVNDPPRPVGILTDRDIVLEILAKDVDLDSVTIGDVMSFDLVTTSEDTPLSDVITTMKLKGVRRIPVVKDNGELAGILSSDDLLEIVSEELQGLASLVSHEITRESRSRV